VQPLQEVARWTEQYRNIWEARLDRMEEHLDRISHQGKDNE
jgi:hypothetical protein